MAARRWALLAGCAVASAVACVDLFHSTATKSLCQIDASACVDAGVDLCDAGDPQANALRACAWLSACGHPVGQNMTGRCMVDAVLAYDCAANPSRRPQGKAKAFWECMLGATTCDAVLHCAFPYGGLPSCQAGGFIGCSQSPGINDDTRYDCVVGFPDGGPPAPGEDCAMVGQTCDSLDRDAQGNVGNDMAICTGPAGRQCAMTGCLDGGPDAAFLSVCDDAGVDHGLDCASVGAQRCDDHGAAAACVPTGSGTCPTTTAIACAPGAVAQGCVTGIPEQVNCTPITGPLSCNPIDAGQVGTVPSDACFAADAGCDADTCDMTGDLVACVRGWPVHVACADAGLSPCNQIKTEEGFLSSCTPP